MDRMEHLQSVHKKNSWIVGDEDEMQQMLQASNRVNESSSLAASGNLFSSNRLKVLHVLHHKMWIPGNAAIFDVASFADHVSKYTTRLNKDWEKDTRI